MVFEIILGIGTLLILAFQGWILWRQTKIINSQKEIARDQSIYLMRKEDPQIDVQKREYEGDKLTLSLYNGGGTKAVGVALKTEVLIVKPEVVKRGDQLFASNRGEWDISKQIDFKDGEKSYSLGSSVFEIFHYKSNYPELETNQGRILVSDISFGLYDKKEKFPTPTKTVSFKELLDLLKKNNVIGCEVKISLLYKNLSNKVVEELQIDKFYIMPPKLKSKSLSELSDKDKLKGGMKYIPIHPFMKQEINISKSEETYRSINHCER